MHLQFGFRGRWRRWLLSPCLVGVLFFSYLHQHCTCWRRLCDHPCKSVCLFVFMWPALLKNYWKAWHEICSVAFLCCKTEMINFFAVIRIWILILEPDSCMYVFLLLSLWVTSFTPKLHDMTNFLKGRKSGSGLWSGISDSDSWSSFMCMCLFAAFSPFVKL